jgi:DsbC/DsbD-like thiol-disulfide interchange protein
VTTDAPHFAYWMLFTSCLLAAPRSDALESSAVKTPHAEVTLISETNAVEPGRPFRLGLHFKLVKGWHIYWVNPGDAGEAPRLELILPEGAKGSDIAWPAPFRIPEGQVMTYGYLDEVVLPLTVTAQMVETSFPVEAKASWVICGKICVPEQGSFRLDMAVGREGFSPQGLALRQCRSAYPPDFALCRKAGAGRFFVRRRQ